MFLILKGTLQPCVIIDILQLRMNGSTSLLVHLSETSTKKLCFGLCPTISGHNIFIFRFGIKNRAAWENLMSIGYSNCPWRDREISLKQIFRNPQVNKAQKPSLNSGKRERGVQDDFSLNHWQGEEKHQHTCKILLLQPISIKSSFGLSVELISSSGLPQWADTQLHRRQLKKNPAGLGVVQHSASRLKKCLQEAKTQEMLNPPNFNPEAEKQLLLQLVMCMRARTHKHVTFAR